MEPQSYRVTFIADTGFIADLKAFAAVNPALVAVESERPEVDATRLGFDLNTAAAIVTIISGALYTGELAAKVLTWLNRARGNKIVLQSPFATLELHKATQLTEADVRRFLETAQHVQ